MTWHYQADDAYDDDEADYLAVKHYLLYWKVDSSIRPQIGQYMTTAYAASNYLKRVKPGDVLWIVNVHQHELYLLGRLKVEFVVDDTSIAQELVDPLPDEWLDADWYAISNKYTIEPMREIQITHIADKLRFNSKVSEMLDMIDGRVDAHQLTTLRQLIVHSAQMMDDIWYNDAYTPQSVQDFWNFPKMTPLMQKVKLSLGLYAKGNAVVSWSMMPKHNLGQNMMADYFVKYVVLILMMLTALTISKRIIPNQSPP